MIRFRGRKRVRPRAGQSSDPGAHLARHRRRGAGAALQRLQPHCSTSRPMTRAACYVSNSTCYINK